MMTTTRNRATTGKMMALGLLLAALAVPLMMAAKPAHASTTFTVNSTADHSDAVLGVDGCFTGYTVDGAGGAKVPECTLRAALNEANYTSGADTINFAIAGTGVKSIAPESELPNITEAVTINGYSQPGAKPNTKAVGSDAVLKIELNGTGVRNGYGLQIGAANSTVKGLVINRWVNRGIEISGSGATGNKVVGNYVGTDASGTQDLGNSTGVYIEGALNTVGGATAGERNVISGNDGEGVVIYGTGATGNKVTGNYIGTDKTGTRALGNADQGVFIGFAPNNTVGGTSAGERNVISANGDSGVLIVGAEARGNK